MSYKASAGSKSHLFSTTATAQSFSAAMEATRSIRKGSVLGMAAEAMTTSWSMLATAGREKTFLRGRTFSTKPSPPPSSRSSTRSPTRGEIPSLRNFPLARQARMVPPMST